MKSNCVCRKKENGLGFDTHTTIFVIPISKQREHNQSFSYRENTTSLPIRTIPLPHQGSRSSCNAQSSFRSSRSKNLLTKNNLLPLFSQYTHSKGNERAGNLKIKGTEQSLVHSNYRILCVRFQLLGISKDSNQQISKGSLL